MQESRKSARISQHVVVAVGNGTFETKERERWAQIPDENPPFKFSNSFSNKRKKMIMKHQYKIENVNSISKGKVE